MTKQDKLADEVKRLADIVSKMTPPIPAIPPIPPIPPIPAIVPRPEDNTVILKMVVLETKVDQIQSDVTDLKKQNVTYVTQSQHQEVVRVQLLHDDSIEKLKEQISDVPLIRKLAYGMVSFILLAVLSSVVYLVVVH